MIADTGSRDELRARLGAAMAALHSAAQEVAVLKSNSKKIEYRASDAYIGQAICAIELAQIAMRKRKKVQGEPTKIDAIAVDETVLA